MNAIVPISRVAVSVRLATMDDIPFMDALQSQFPQQVGHFKTTWFDGYIKTNGVLVAESNGTRVGYVISRDRYQKRDELGVIYQLCVAPGEQRKLVGAELIRAVFDRSAYGCKLYCCWCAQDIEANHFWESIGFVPIAFRAGSGKKKRVHIFWQRRIREGDVGEKATPWWFPAETTGGAIGEGRIVLPIPPGTHWSDAKPIVLPALSGVEGPDDGSTKLEAPKDKQARNPKSKAPNKAGAGQVAIIVGGRIRYVDRPGHAATKQDEPAKAAKPKKQKRPKAKNDPKYIAAARELRDRYLEHVNGGQLELESVGKYDVSRALPDARAQAIGVLPAPRAAC